MTTTLHELAMKLQDSIIKQQENAHDSGSLNISKYNNLKLKMSTTIKYPHVVVTIGISEAIFNISDLTKTEGGLGPDERYVRKWLDNSNILYDLSEIYVKLSEMAEANEEVYNRIALSEEGEAEDAEKTNPRSDRGKKRDGLLTIEEMMAEMEQEQDEIVIDSEKGENYIKEQMLQKAGYLKSVEDIKKDIRSFLKSSLKKFN